jgi:Glycosyltransferase
MKITAWPYCANKRDNPYNAMIYKELIGLGALVKEGKWYKPSIFVDVFHMHWPDAIFGSKKKWLIPTKFLILFLVLSLMKLFGVKIIWTVHNVKPHSNSLHMFHKLVYKILFTLADGLIFLNEGSRRDICEGYKLKLPSCVIKHPTYTKYYRDSIASFKKNDSKGLNFLVFGQIRLNKSIEKCVKIIKIPNVKLTIAGSVKDERAAKLITDEADKCNKDYVGKLDLRFCWQKDDELLALILNSDAVLLPYSEITNSGVIFLALSLGKRVIAQDNEYFRLMAEDFKGGVELVDFDDLESLRLAIERLGEFKSDYVVGAEYQVEAVAREHVAFFNGLLV